MLIAEIEKSGKRTIMLLEEPRPASRSVIEIAPLFPRRDLVPSLLPFERAVLHVSDILTQVQQLFREDLADLRQPLFACLQQAQSDAERSDAKLAMTLFMQMLQSIPLQLPSLLDCFRHMPSRVLVREGREKPEQQDNEMVANDANNTK